MSATESSAPAASSSSSFPTCFEVAKAASETPVSPRHKRSSEYKNLPYDLFAQSAPLGMESLDAKPFFQRCKEDSSQVTSKDILRGKCQQYEREIVFQKSSEMLDWEDLDGTWYVRKWGVFYLVQTKSEEEFLLDQWGLCSLAEAMLAYKKNPQKEASWQIAETMPPLKLSELITPAEIETEGKKESWATKGIALSFAFLAASSMAPVFLSGQNLSKIPTNVCPLFARPNTTFEPICPAVDLYRHPPYMQSDAFLSPEEGGSSSSFVGRIFDAVKEKFGFP